MLRRRSICWSATSAPRWCSRWRRKCGQTYRRLAIDPVIGDCGVLLRDNPAVPAALKGDHHGLPTKIIVTGAAQGIGRAVALRLAVPGAHVAVWDTQADGVEETARLCREQGAVARAWPVDVGDADQIESAVAAFEREWGAPDGLVNNAGIFPRARALDMKLSEWERVLRVNLTGTFVCARAVARA